MRVVQACPLFDQGCARNLQVFENTSCLRDRDFRFPDGGRPPCASGLARSNASVLAQAFHTQSIEPDLACSRFILTMCSLSQKRSSKSRMILTRSARIRHGRFPTCGAIFKGWQSAGTNADNASPRGVMSVKTSKCHMPPCLRSDEYARSWAPRPMLVTRD